MEHLIPLSAAILVALAGLVLVWRLPGECRCEKCGFHVNEARLRREKQRAKRHRDLHSWSRVPWGPEKCTVCAAGFEHDERET